MAKRNRSGEISGILKCDQFLSTCSFEEENWSPCVAWIVGRQPEDFKHIEALNIIVQTGIRKLFSVITKEQLCIDVRELGDPKTKKSKEVPPYSEICEACKTFLDIGEPVPTPLMAKLIKWKMLISKEADLRRLAADNKSTTEKKKGKEKDSNKEKPKSPKKGDKKTAEGQHAKEGSKMKKRGEDDEERKYIDDEPEDGPQRYFIITGFHDPYLFQFLETINVNVNCIISVTSQDCFKYEDDASVADERVEVLEQELKIFWRDVGLLLQRQPDNSSLHDIARLDYEVSYLTVPSDPLDTEQRVSYSTTIYEDIALLLYNLTDAKRLYQCYMENLKIIKVPFLNEKGSIDTNRLVESQTSEKSLLQTVDMRYYSDLMNTVPNESVSVALIMHCMLEQVVATEKGIDPPSEQAAAAKTDKINAELSAYLGEVTAKLGLTAHEQEVLSKLFDFQETKEEKSEYPKVINIHDKISIRTHHLKPTYGFNAEEVERKMLRLLPVSKLCEMTKSNSVEARKKAARFLELFHFCSLMGLSKPEVDHALKQFVFECMELTKCDRNGFPLQKIKEGLPQQPIPWDDPYPYFKLPMPPMDTTTTEDLPTPDGSERDREERDEETATLAYHGHSNISVGKQKPPRNSEAQRISDVMMELVVTLDRDACTVAAEKPFMKFDISMRPESTGLDPKRGIMVNVAESQVGSIRYSHSNSVRFDVPSTPKELEELCPDVIGLKDAHESLLEITDSQQRNMNGWCFAEHYSPDIFLQVLQEGMYHLPYIELYHANREEVIMLVIHNPYSRERQNNSNWHNELHSNTGFRNYLENTVESIQTWLKMKEAEYKAAQLFKAASIQKDEEEKQKAMDKTDKKGKRSPQRSGKSRSPGLSSTSSFEVGANLSNPYVRQGSLKAFQAEQTRLATEEEEKERIKNEKLNRSTQKLKEKQEKEKEKFDKGRKSLPKTSQSKRTSVTASDHSGSQADFNLENNQEGEKYTLPFYGYNTGNQLIHFLGTTSTLFPSDGGTIQTERTEAIQGSTTIRSAVKKDGHIFVVHIINPREDMNLPEEYIAQLDAANEAIIHVSDRSEKEVPKDGGLNLGMLAGNMETNTSEQNLDTKKKDETKVRTRRYAVSQFGSITAHLSDGMILAISQFGPTGESYLHPYEPPMYIQSADLEAPLQINPSTSPIRSKTKGNVLPDVDKEKFAHTEESIPEEPVTPGMKAATTQKQEFQELYVTCPDGLTIKYFLQNSTSVGLDSIDVRQLLVRQSYPFKTSGIQNCESFRNKYIQSEVSRVITPDGNVIKNMVDGSVEVLGSDGTLSVFTGAWSYGMFDSAGRAPKPTPRGKRAQKSKQRDGADRSKTPSPNWTITYPNGERLRISKETGNIVELPSLPVCVACDPETKQIICTRDDQVIVITYPDGGTIVEHADGTRISTYYKDITVLDEAEASSPRNYIQTMKFIKVECPAFATVEFNTATSENLTVFGNGTNINVFPDGYYMFHHSKGGRIEIDTEGTMTYFPQRNRFREQLDSSYDVQYVIRHNADVIVETVDPNGNVFTVHSNGESAVVPAILEDLYATKSRLKTENSQMEGCPDNHAPRFFIVHDDCSGTELLRYSDVAEYLLLADQNPAAAVLSEEIPNRPGVTSITVLKPFLSGISEIWLKKYDQDCIVPQGLRCRDLKTIPSKEYKKPGPVFGTNVGKGLNIGTNIKTSAKIPILKCPEKLEMRQLLQFQPVTEEMRQKLLSALREFATEVLTRMQAESLLSIEDLRSQEEKQSAHDLRILADSFTLAAKKYETEHLKSIYEQAITPPPPCPSSKPPPKRAKPDLEQDRKDKEEEERRLIRKTIFEPYFESELGKVFIEKMASGLDDDDTQNKDMDNECNDRRHSNTPERNDGQNVSVKIWNQNGAAENRYPKYNALPEKLVTDPIFYDYLKRESKNFTRQDVNDGMSLTPRLDKRNTLLEKSVPRVSEYLQQQLEKLEKLSQLDVQKNELSQPLDNAQFKKSELGKVQGKLQSDHQKFTASSNGSVKSKREFGSLHDKAVLKKHLMPFIKLPTKKPISKIVKAHKNTGADKETGADNEADSGQSSIIPSIRTDVYGKPRSESQIVLPVAIQGGKPGAHPNLKFSEIEDPVRPQIKTASVAGANVKSGKHLKKMRGLIVYPQKANFGTLIEGNLYTYMVTLTNTGIDACRFKVRRPPSSAGLTVKHTVGSVAAGMSVDLNLELYAMAGDKDATSGGDKYSYTLQIVTETDFLELQVLANILTAEEYDNPLVAPHLKRFTSARIVRKKSNQPEKRLSKQEIDVI